MDRRLEYGDVIKSVLLEWKEFVERSLHSGSEMVIAFDDENEVYFLIELGWREHKRIQIPFFLIRIVAGKVWIEENRTDRDIAVELMEAGIPRDQIVLGLQPPNMRPYTDYAVA